MARAVQEVLLMNTYDRIGKYKIISKLGEGGMATVYLGKDESGLLDRHAAIKVMHKELINDSDFQERFIQEARITAKLKHPNIIQIYEMYKEQLNNGDIYYIAMEFVSQDGVNGRTLRDIINERGKNKPIDFNQEQSLEMFLKMFSQLVSALAYAHSENVLHCDIKPANILIDKEWDVKLSDFGLAKVIGKQRINEGTLGPFRTGYGNRNVQANNIEGTFQYMSPEVQDGGEWTKSGDIYSLGMVVYQLLTGKRASGRWKNACEIVKDLPSWFGDLLDKCLSTEPEERFSDGKELLAAYEESIATTKIRTPITEVNQFSDDPQLKIIEKTYQNALSKMNSAITEEDFKAASQEFISISGYKDADALVAKCENSAYVIAEWKKADEAEKNKAKAEKLRIEAKKELAAKAEKESIDKERAAQTERERIERERLAQAKKERIERKLATKAERKRIKKEYIAQAEERERAAQVERGRIENKRFVQEKTITIAALLLFGAFIIWLLSPSSPPPNNSTARDLASPTIIITAPPAGQVGVPYNHTFRASGTTPMTWSIASGVLPIGLNLSRTGIISGTPTLALTANITIVATNSVGSDRVDIKIVINPPPPTYQQQDATAQFDLGLKHYKNKDYAQAIELFRKVAEQGHANAQNYLGHMYSDGLGVTQDDKQAFEWYRKAAEQGHADAQCSLGWMYRNGKGVPQDNNNAVEWYRKAAEQGNTLAQHNLGYMYDGGRGVPQDDKKAVELYRKAAEQGISSAQNNLGIMYKNGRGVQQDDRQAVEWFRKAAEKGYANAQCNLGFMYDEGRGVSQDKNQAIEWYRKAAEQGQDTAKENLLRLQNNFFGFINISSGVTIRTKPDPDSAIHSLSSSFVRKNAFVQGVGSQIGSDDEQWYEILFGGGNKGWIRASRVTHKERIQESQNGFINGDNVILRPAPDTWPNPEPSNSLRLHRGNPVRVMASITNLDNERWLNIERGGNVGWVNADYVVWTNVGEIIQFGSNSWQVLDIQNNRALILSEKITERRRFHEKNESVTWENCTLRRYLNGEFYNKLSIEERSRIIETRIPNNNNQWYNTRGGNATNDRIFLLSIEEIVKYFGDSGDLRNRKGWYWEDGKDVLKDGEGYYVNDRYNSKRIAMDASNNSHNWWLRSSGYSGNYATLVYYDGAFDIQGFPVNSNDIGVRPALWLNPKIQ